MQINISLITNCRISLKKYCQFIILKFMQCNYLAFFLYQILIAVLCYWYNTKSHLQMDYFETIKNIYYILVSLSHSLRKAQLDYWAFADVTGDYSIRECTVLRGFTQLQGSLCKLPLCPHDMAMRLPPKPQKSHTNDITSLLAT